MYYFYLNFPNFKSKPIRIHIGSCGHCNSGNGKLSLSNSRGFWAGPFQSLDDIDASLKELQKIVTHPFTYEKCSCCGG